MFDPKGLGRVGDGSPDSAVGAPAGYVYERVRWRGGTHEPGEGRTVAALPQPGNPHNPAPRADHHVLAPAKKSFGPSWGNGPPGCLRRSGGARTPQAAPDAAAE